MHVLDIGSSPSNSMQLSPHQAEMIVLTLDLTQLPHNHLMQLPLTLTLTACTTPPLEASPHTHIAHVPTSLVPRPLPTHRLFRGLEGPGHEASNLPPPTEKTSYRNCRDGVPKGTKQGRNDTIEFLRATIPKSCQPHTHPNLIHVKLRVKSLCPQSFEYSKLWKALCIMPAY